MEIDPHLRTVWLKGEISNFNHHSRGHMYFTIKDNQSRIQAVMFSGNNRTLKFIPKNGMNVLIKGEVNVFEPYGQYQLYIREMQPDGIGALYLAYEQLKDKLSVKGYFDEQYKQPIPKFPDHIGIITSPTGAAVRDIITTIKRRFPIVQITILPVLVQGEEAPISVQTAIELANELDLFDTLIVARGGGSIEDLWGFNNEAVAKAIFHSNIPVITGIGHETDLTISDHVADLRAPTPTGAAELAVPDITELRTTIYHLRARLTKLTQVQTMKKTEALQALKKSYAFHLPKQLINEKEQYVDRLTDQLKTSFSTFQKQKLTSYTHTYTRFVNAHPNKKLLTAIETKSKIEEQLHKKMLNIMNEERNKLHSLIDKLTLLNPLQIMKRGFAVPYTKEGTLIKSVTDIKINDQLEVLLTDGSFQCQVQNVRRDDK